jgi:hypothetical protein
VSTYLQILDSVVSTLSQVPPLAGVTIRKRKRPFVDRERGETLPAVCVSPSREKIESLHFTKGAKIDYPVFISVIESGDLLYLDPSWMLETRERIRLALYRPALDGVPAVFDCDYDPNPAYDFAGLEASLDVSVQLFTFRAAEPRSNE